MKLKQIIMTLAILGLGFSLPAMLSSDIATAQEAVPAACIEDPESERCQHCKAGVLAAIEANGCNLVSGSSAEGEEVCDGPDCCGGVKTSIIKGDLCEGEGEEGGVIFGLLKSVLRIMTAGVGIAAVGGIAYGALLYTTAENKPDQTKKAIGIITNVVIGIAAYAAMYLLLNFLIPGGIFG